MTAFKREPLEYYRSLSDSNLDYINSLVSFVISEREKERENKAQEKRRKEAERRKKSIESHISNIGQYSDYFASFPVNAILKFKGARSGRGVRKFLRLEKYADGRIFFVCNTWNGLYSTTHFPEKLTHIWYEKKWVRIAEAFKKNMVPQTE